MILGAPREFFIAFGDSEHRHPTFGVVHLLGLRANFLGAVSPVLRILDQAMFHRGEKCEWPFRLSPHCYTAPVY
jgi:hypothetical protein